MKKLKFLLLSFFIWRVFLFIPLLIGLLFIPYRENLGFTNIINKIDPASISANIFLYPWANFDGVHYLSISGYGYITEGRFFPLYPILINFFSQVIKSPEAFGIGQFLIGFLISNISFLISLYLLFKLVVSEYSEKIAKISIIFLLIFPTSFFFISIYSESLFLLLVLLSFYFIQKKQWILVGICGFLLTLTRFVGIFILPAIIYEFFKQEKVIKIIKNQKKGKEILIKILPLLLVPMGLISYAIYCFYKWGNFLYFLTAHSELGNSRVSNTIVLPIQTVFRYFKILTDVSYFKFEWWVALLELLTFLLISYLLFLGWKKGIKKSYLIFSAFAFLIPIFSGTFSALPRYAIIIFPIFITLALIKNLWVKVIYSIVSPILFFILLMFFSRGYFIA